MSAFRAGHMIERAVERMVELGSIPSNFATVKPPNAGSLGGGQAKPDAFACPQENAAADATQSSVAPLAELTPPVEVATPKPSVHSPVVTLATLNSAGLAVAAARRSRITEEWRVTSGHLLRSMRAVHPVQGAPTIPNLLMVTSSKPREGKSFSALNLSSSIALGGQSEVLLLDIDSKPNSLTPSLGLGDRLGLFDLVADPSLRLEDLVLATEIPGFSILPIGRAAVSGPGSMERTVTRTVIEMIGKLSRRFAKHIMILDSAPCLATSDAATLAPVVKQIALIVEAERTQREDLEATLELLRPCSSITLILNKIRLDTKTEYGEYYYYND
jgi:protein-tyrosine kinase